MLLTRSPLTHPKMSALDLHVLSTPPAFVLSQDQTLQQKLALASALNYRDGVAAPEQIIKLAQHHQSEQ